MFPVKKMKLGLPLKVLLRGVLGIVIFIALLALGNFLKSYISHPFYHFFINTFNQGATIIVALFVLFLLADFSRSLKFPFNLPYPLLNAFGYAYLISLVFELIPIVEALFNFRLSETSNLRNTAIIAVFALVTAFGYFKVFKNRHKTEETADKDAKEAKETPKQEEKPETKEQKTETIEKSKKSNKRKPANRQT